MKPPRRFAPAPQGGASSEPGKPVLDELLDEYVASPVQVKAPRITICKIKEIQ